MKKCLSIGMAVLILCAALAPLRAQETKTQFKKELVRLKYLDAGPVERLIRPYLSREGGISFDPQGEKLMVIVDHPEFVDKVLAVIKEIDVKPADLLITAQLVVGSSAGEDKADESFLNDPIIKELKGFLRYKSFAQLDANLIRTIEGERTQMTLGKNAEFILELRPKYTNDGDTDYIQIELRLVLLKKAEPAPAAQPVPPAQTIPPAPGQEGRVTPPPSASQTLIQTELTIKSGDKTVVGVSRLDGGDKGLILVLSGKVIR